MKKYFLLLLLAVFAFSSCDNASNQAREVHPFIKSLEGTWKTDSYVLYNEEWKDIVEILIENGQAYPVGATPRRYTFNADGTLTYSMYTESPPIGWEEIGTYPCYYNEETKILTIKNEKGQTYEFLVSDYDGEYLVLDYTQHSYDSYIDKHYYRYVRETLKTRQE